MRTPGRRTRPRPTPSPTLSGRPGTIRPGAARPSDTGDAVMHSRLSVTALALLAWAAAVARTREPVPGPTALVEVRADVATAPVSRLLTGACIEDVNHEIYGGLYSQMVFGESFQEPPTLTDRLKGFRVLGGRWQVRQGELHFSGDRGGKLVSELPAFTDGEVGDRKSVV